MSFNRIYSAIFLFKKVNDQSLAMIWNIIKDEHLYKDLYTNADVGGINWFENVESNKYLVPRVNEGVFSFYRIWLITTLKKRESHL